jgi:hypothetical protein
LYPVTYEADYLRERNRLTTFFRLIVAIPWLIVAYVYAIVQMVVVVIAWFAILILGRFPEGMYNLVGGILRFSMRVQGFTYMQTDAWPGFGISEDDSYPIRVRFHPPAARQSRVKTFFRIILAIPLLVLSYPMSFLLSGVAMVSWLTIVFRGYQPAAIHNALAYFMGWTTRANAYMFLMRDEYPPVGDETPVEIDPPAGALPRGDQAPLDPAPEAQGEVPPPPAQ